jgi:hypothetical protein
MDEKELIERLGPPDEIVGPEDRMRSNVTCPGNFEPRIA